ncbi:hypothetical protein [Nocardia brasiliensis]|uniref:hypothetical protein n=1 Tax=Nocardia brasiliensis TaxID=37326 RepID=UPI003D925467
MSSDDLVQFEVCIVPPRSVLGAGIVFDAVVICSPNEPRFPYFVLTLMKVDYGTPERIECEVSRAEFHDPAYFPAGAYYLSGYYDSGQDHEVRNARYYAVLRMYQIHDEGVAAVVVDTKPPVKILP